MSRGFSGFPNTRKRNDEGDGDEDEFNDDDIAHLIKSYNNHIYFYAPVNDKTALALNMTINEVTNKVMKNCVDFEMCPNIYLHINSGGGEVNAALSTVDTIRNNKIPIVSVIEGSAASAATLISMVCHERHIHKHAMMLIHQISGGFWGKMEEFKDEMKNMKQTMKIIMKIYKKYGKIPDEKLSELLKKDIWWKSKKCLKMGLVDKVID